MVYTTLCQLRIRFKGINVLNTLYDCNSEFIALTNKNAFNFAVNLMKYFIDVIRSVRNQ